MQRFPDSRHGRLAIAAVVTLLITSMCCAAVPQEEPQLLSASTLVSVLAMMVAALLGLWSRKQDRDIDRAQKAADAAREKAEHVEVSMLTHYRPAVEFARSVEAMLKPLHDDSARTRKDIEHIKRMIYTGSRFVDPRQPQERD